MHQYQVHLINEKEVIIMKDSFNSEKSAAARNISQGSGLLETSLRPYSRELNERSERPDIFAYSGPTSEWVAPEWLKNALQTEPKADSSVPRTVFTAPTPANTQA